MTGNTTESAHRLWWRALAVVLGIAAPCCLVMWAASTNSGPGAHGQTASAAPPSSGNPAGVAPATSATTTTPTPAARPPARPRALSIPAIGVKTRVIRLGQHQDGTVEVPENPAEAGWFRLGPPPGAAGSSVILGHVDSLSGPAVFYRLKELHPGDRIAVRLDDGTTVRFRVHSIKTYANADFPAKKVYGRQGRSQLNLVTCGGSYDPSRGGYQANVVVNSRRMP